MVVRSYSRHKVSLRSFSAAVGAFQVSLGADTLGDTGILVRKTVDSGTPPPLASVVQVLSNMSKIRRLFVSEGPAS